MSSPIYKPVHQNGQKYKETTKEDTNIPDFEVMDTRCGFWLFRPALMKPCAHIGLFTTFYSVAALVTSSLSVYVTSQITTLERQFGFSSKQTGVIMAANDIGYLVCVLFVSYSASRLHIPRSLGVATVIFGLSGIACSLPHFIFGTSQGSDTHPDILNITSAAMTTMRSSMFGALCESSNTTRDSCEASAARKSALPLHIAPEQVAKASLVIIVIGMMLQGFGKAPRSSLTITYLDDNTAKANTGFYMGIIATVGILGPAVAFLMGGVFSKMYVSLQPTTLTPRHPRWIGAWWLGYVLFGCIAILVSIPLFCFPRRLNGKDRRTEKAAENGATPRIHKNKNLILDLKPSKTTNTSPLADKHHPGSNPKESVIQRFGPKFILKHSRKFVATLFRLVTNPVYICMVVSGCFLIFAVGGSSSYTPKYLERMFNLPSHMANYIIAGQTLCTSCIGTFIGGYLTKRMKMTTMAATKFVIFVVSVSLAAQIMGFVFQCDQPDVHNWPSQENDCSNSCNCQDNSYFPVCGEDGKTYYSPCHAGCEQVEGEIYQNCTCIQGGSAKSETCDYSCPHLYAYVTFMGIRSLFGTLSIVPKMIVFIRCVAHKDRPLAMGFGSFMMSLLGWLLGPIVFGYIIDGICVIWDVQCGVVGRCLLYDNTMFRLKLHAVGSAGLLLSLIFICVAYVYARWTKCLDEPKDEDGKVKETTAEMILMRKVCDDEEEINGNSGDSGSKSTEGSKATDNIRIQQ